MLIETCTYIKANIGFSSYQKVLPAIIRQNKICNTVDKRHICYDLLSLNQNFYFLPKAKIFVKKYY